MAGISYNTHTYCSKCVQFFSKQEYPDIIWCPNKCKTRVRYNAKSVLSKRKKHQFNRIDSSPNPLQRTEPHDYMIKRPQTSVIENQDIDSSQIPNVMRLITVKTALSTMEKELHKFEEISQLGKSIAKIGDNIKLINDGINIEGITEDILKNQEWFTANLESKKKSFRPTIDHV